MTPCPKHPEKMRYEGVVPALDALLARFEQTHSHIKRMYLCAECGGYHFTSKRRPAWVPGVRKLIPVGFNYAVVVGGRKVWQASDAATASRKAVELGGEVVYCQEIETNWKRWNAARDRIASRSKSL